MASDEAFAYRPRMRWLILASFLIGLAGAARAGETGCWFDNGAVVVPAAFGDIAGDFLIDPAQPKSALHVTSAEMFGITGASARGTLRLAGRRITGLTVKIVDLGALARPFPAGLAGVIGADALAGHWLVIETAPCRVWLDGRRPRGRGLSLRRVAGSWAVKAAISDGVRARQGWFAVSTAAWPSQIAGAALARQPAPGSDPPVRLRALSLGGRLFENLPAAVIDHAPAGLDGSIGMAVWSRFRVGLDLRRRALELTPR